MLPRPLDERWLRPRSRAAPISREPPSEEGSGPGPSPGSGPRAGSSKTLPSLGPARARTPRPEKGGPGAPSPTASPGPATHPAGTQPCSQRRPTAGPKALASAATSPVRPDGHRQPHGAQPAPRPSPTAQGKHNPTPQEPSQSHGAAPHSGTPASPTARALPGPAEKQRLHHRGQSDPDPGSEGGPAAPSVLGAPIPVPIAAPARSQSVPGVPEPPRPDGASYLAPGGRTAGPGRGRPPAGAGRGGG